MMLSNFKETYKPETSPYWRTPEGINQRIELLGQQFTYQVVNNSLQVYGETYGAKAFTWITHPESSAYGRKHGEACSICAPKHGHVYYPGQFLPSLPAHNRCVCQWEIVWSR